MKAVVVILIITNMISGFCFFAEVYFLNRSQAREKQWAELVDKISLRCDKNPEHRP